MNSTQVKRLNYRIVLVFLTLAFIFSPLGYIGYAGSEFPDRSINFYNPFAPGGGVDRIARPLADSASRILGQPVVVINKPGGSATLAPTSLKTMKPDGYNICIGMISLLYLPLNQEVPYDLFKDFTYICRFSETIMSIIVRTDSSWKSLKDLIEYAKANPGKIKYAAPAGPGTTPHCSMSEIGLKEGTKWEIVPYRGGAKAVAALLGGHVQVAIANVMNAAPYVKSGELRLLATLSEERVKRFSEVPTLKELGYFSYSAPVGIIGPAGMPKDVVNILDGGFKKALHDPEVQKAYEVIDAPISYMNSTDYTKWVKETYVYLSKVFEEMGIRKK